VSAAHAQSGYSGTVPSTIQTPAEASGYLAYTPPDTAFTWLTELSALAGPVMRVDPFLTLPDGATRPPAVIPVASLGIGAAMGGGIWLSEDVQPARAALIITDDAAGRGAITLLQPVLEEAGIQSAGLLIAVTNSDAVNILACQAAKAEEMAKEGVSHPIDLGLEEHLDRETPYLGRHTGRAAKDFLHFRWEDPLDSLAPCSQGMRQLGVGERAPRRELRRRAAAREEHVTNCKHGIVRSDVCEVGPALGGVPHHVDARHERAVARRSVSVSRITSPKPSR